MISRADLPFDPGPISETCLVPDCDGPVPPEFWLLQNCERHLDLHMRHLIEIGALPVTDEERTRLIANLDRRWPE